MKIRPCIYNHEDFGNRNDGRCARCHVERNQRYRMTLKARETEHTYETSRQTRPERIYYRIKWFIKDRIKNKTHKVQELERVL